MQNDKDNMNARRAWDMNARFWDEHMGEGNDFFNLLIWPVVERLLSVQAGWRILDIACGNGLTSRRLLNAGAHVVAVDFSEELIGIAKKRDHGREIDYRAVDATNYDALVELGIGTFDAALCNMALMDIADICPLMKALAKLLRKGSVFVFSVLHPCFNNPSIIQMTELEDREGRLDMTHSIKVSRYLTSYARLGAAMPEQPVPQPYFHRSLQTLVGSGLDVGFVLDALEERAFPPGYQQGTNPLSWRAFSEIPPVLVARMRRGA